MSKHSYLPLTTYRLIHKYMSLLEGKQLRAKENKERHINIYLSQLLIRNAYISTFDIHDRR